MENMEVNTQKLLTHVSTRPFAHLSDANLRAEIEMNANRIQSHSSSIAILIKPMLEELIEEQKIRGELLPFADKQDGDFIPFHYHPAPPFVSVNQN